MGIQSDDFNIALCDDDIFIHEEIKKALEEYGRSRGIRVKDIYFKNASELFVYTGKFQVLLLDIDMPNIDGIEAGLMLRKKHQDCRIIMLTGMRERIAECFKIGAFRFVEKPIEGNNTLFEALDDALTTYMGYKKIEVRYKNKSIEIYQYNIEHIYSMGNFVKIITDKNVFEKNVSIKKIMTELDDRLFIQTQKSHIVNLSFVVDVKSNRCILSTGEEVPVSRREYKGFVEAYSLYDAKGYNGIRNGYFY